MKKYIDETTVSNKNIILRLDLNVPIIDGIISDDFRIVSSTKTINYLIEKNAKVIILSHLGKVKEENDLTKNSLKAVAKKLSEILNRKVYFFDKCYSSELKAKIDDIKYGEVILLENTRHMDYPDNLESNCDDKLSKYWASLGDVFVFDAFGASHRKHASTTGISKYLPTYLGFLMQEELTKLDKLINIDKRPFTVFMGGAKVESKLPIIRSLLPRTDYLLLGGGILNSFLKAKGVNIHDSLATDEEEVLNELKNLLSKYSDKIILTEKIIMKNNKIIDISIDDYLKYLNESKIIFVNGTPGVFEDKDGVEGTKSLFEKLKLLKADILIGGGDTVSYLKLSNNKNTYYHVSTGGGATLSYVATNKLLFLEKR